jgi:ribosomal protein S17E
MGKDLLKKFPGKFTRDFDNNKHAVHTLVKGGTPKVLNQIAGYITRSIAAEQKQLRDESSEQADSEGAEPSEEVA